MMLQHQLTLPQKGAGRTARFAQAGRGLKVNQRIIARTAAPAATEVDSPYLANVEYMNPKWATVETEEQFMDTLKGELASVKAPPQLLYAWQDFFNNYKKAITTSGAPGANLKLASKIQASIADCVLKEFKDPYTFPSAHMRLLAPYNYFEFGQRYVGSLTDFNNSVLGHPDRWAEVQRLLNNKENVVILANHQTEADPGVFAHMLISKFPELAKEVIYVAGDRVITDALCKPFSMGRNLFCVYSKKHLDDVPELKASKMETNRKTVIAMQRRLNEGGALIWIAPSGGRDRPKATGEYLPDPFDPAAVELMRNLAQRAKQPSHLFPMAMYSYPMMPPPKTVEKGLGERRITNYTPVGISLAPELNIESIISSTSDKEQQQQLLATAAFNAVTDEYIKMEKAIVEKAFLKPGSDYVQPWKSS